MKLAKQLKAGMGCSFGKTPVKTRLRSSRSRTGGRSGLKVINISPIYLMFESISKCLNSGTSFFRVLISSIRIPFRESLLLMTSGQRVLRLWGGNPCFQRASSRLLLIVSPELFDFSLKRSFFLVPFQQEQIAYKPRAMYPFSLGLRCL